MGLRELILTGELPAGRRVPELHLVGRIGVSRTPLRLAMEILEHEGLLARRPRGGFVVREFTLAEIEDAIALRGVLEGTAARFAAERLRNPSDLDPLRAAVQAMDPVVGAASLSLELLGRYVEHNERFHLALAELSQSRMLRRLLGNLLSVPFASPNAFFLAQASSPQTREVLIVGQVHHRGLVEAIGRREGTRAEALAREHARLSLSSLHALAHNRDAFRALPGAVLIRFPQALS
jgi:GntR family transcriptional regulator of vanillate catabolism